MEHDFWFWLHIGVFCLAMAALLVAVFCAGLYLWQSRQLKSKHPGKFFFKLPSLDALDKAHRTFLGIGVILFSIGILIGVLWAQKFQEVGCIFKDPKVFLSFLTCFFYWLILSLRVVTFRRGHQIAVGSVLACLLLVLTKMSSHQLAALLRMP